MLKKIAFANSLAVVTAGVFLVLWLISLILPTVFTYVLNSQFYGADIASLVPELTGGQVFGFLVTWAILGWVVGYAWAWLYNKLQ